MNEPTETDTGAALEADAADHAAMRRVAVLAAGGADVQEVLTTILAELEDLLTVETARLVSARLPGVLGAGTGADRSADGPLGQRAERLLEAFSDLLASSEQAARERAGAQRLLDEQRALREVATLAARDVATSELFAAVTRAAGEVTGADAAALGWYGPDGGVEYVASWSRSGAPVALGDAPGAGVPVIVDGRPWGVMNLFPTEQAPLPPDIESRLASFTELVGTAIANGGTREGMMRLTGEHAALRRVATLVAQGVQREQVYSAVTKEAALHLGADFASLSRIDDDDWMTTLATWRRSGEPIPTGRWQLDGESISAAVARTGRPVRRDDFSAATGPLAQLVRSVGARQGVAVPVIVEDGVWGVMAAFSDVGRRLPADTEKRLAEFTALLAMAIANTESRQELAASRARIVATADGARRQIERDLHDGAQQRLVSLGLELQGALALAPPHLTDVGEALSTISRGLTEAQDMLREIAHGVHPAILADAGLRPALKSLTRRSQVPVLVDVKLPRRLAEQVEVAAYYVVKEALDNAVKHAHARSISVRAKLVDDALRIAVSDDGVGGADPSAGSGLVGLKDRVETLSGSFRLRSPEGAGTTLSVEIPVAGD
jgi:signal transduction histidine kinase